METSEKDCLHGGPAHNSVVNTTWYIATIRLIGSAELDTASKLDWDYLTEEQLREAVC